MRLPYRLACTNPVHQPNCLRTASSRLSRLTSSGTHSPCTCPAVQEFIDLWNMGETNGTRGEPPGCGLVNTGTFQALKDAGVQAIYSGWAGQGGAGRGRAGRSGAGRVAAEVNDQHAGGGAGGQQAL